MRERVHRGRLVLAGDDHRPSAVRLQILGDGGDPLLHQLAARAPVCRYRRRRAGADDSGQFCGESFDFCRDFIGSRCSALAPVSDGELSTT